MKLKKDFMARLAVVVLLLLGVCVHANAGGEMTLRKGGSIVGKIEQNGNVRIGGSIKGKFEANGDIRVNGSIEGRIEKNGDIRKRGSIVGKIESNGDVRISGVKQRSNKRGFNRQSQELFGRISGMR